VYCDTVTFNEAVPYSGTVSYIGSTPYSESLLVRKCYHPNPNHTNQRRVGGRTGGRSLGSCVCICMSDYAQSYNVPYSGSVDYNG